MDAAELELARQLAERAPAVGRSLTGPGWLLGWPTKVGEEAEGGFWAAFTRLMIRITSWFLLMMDSYPPGAGRPDTGL